jgi:hypothetical protein
MAIKPIRTQALARLVLKHKETAGSIPAEAQGVIKALDLKEKAPKADGAVVTVIFETTLTKGDEGKVYALAEKQGFTPVRNMNSSPSSVYYWSKGKVTLSILMNWRHEQTGPMKVSLTWRMDVDDPRYEKAVDKFLADKRKKLDSRPAPVSNFSDEQAKKIVAVLKKGALRETLIGSRLFLQVNSLKLFGIRAVTPLQLKSGAKELQAVFPDLCLKHGRVEGSVQESIWVLPKDKAAKLFPKFKAYGL